MIARSLLAIALCCSCAGDSHSSPNPNKTKPPPAGSGAPQTAGSAAPDRSKPMSGTFAAAYAAFRTHAAQQLGIDVDKVQGGPSSEPLAGMVKSRVGSVWAFTMHAAGNPSADVRGWATGNGTVVTLDQNLGALLAEAGVWGGGVKPALTAPEIAERLAWSLGMNHTVFIAPHQGVPAPELQIKDGAGKLSFVVDYRQPGPGGAGGGPRQLTRIDIALTADHRATATRTRIPSP